MMNRYKKVSTWMTVVCVLYMCLVSIFHLRFEVSSGHNQAQLLISSSHQILRDRIQSNLNSQVDDAPKNQSIKWPILLSPRFLKQPVSEHDQKILSGHTMNASQTIHFDVDIQTLDMFNKQRKKLKKFREKTRQMRITQNKETDILFNESKLSSVLQIQVEFLLTEKDVYVYGTFLDTRYLNGRYVRFLVLQRTSDKNKNLLCQFGTTQYRPTNVKAEVYEMCENHGKEYGGWIYSCKVPADARLYTVSLGSDHGNLQNFGSLESMSLLSNITKKEQTSNSRHMPDKGQQQLLNDKDKKLNFSLDQIINGVSNAHRYLHQKQTLVVGSSISSTRNNIGTSNSSSSSSSSSSRSSNNSRSNNSRSSSSSNNSGSSSNSSTSSRNNSSSSSRNSSSTSMKIGVCVPPLFGDICLSKIINFIEMCRLLGADKVFLYIHDIPKEILAFLQDYSGDNPNILTLFRWDLPVFPKKPQSLETNQIIWNHGQLLAVQHCLYTNMISFDWLLFIDTDEMLIPQTTTTWPELLIEIIKTHSQASNETIAGISFESAFFQQDFQTQATNSIDYFQHLHRTRNTNIRRSKVFIQPFHVFELGIHHISKTVFEQMSVIRAKPNQALLHHYRKCDPNDDLGMYLQCEILVKDETVLRYEPPLTKASKDVIARAMKFLAGKR